MQNTKQILAPDWDLWRDILAANVTQLACLSLNINPMAWEEVTPTGPTTDWRRRVEVSPTGPTRELRRRVEESPNGPTRDPRRRVEVSPTGPTRELRRREQVQPITQTNELRRRTLVLESHASNCGFKVTGFDFNRETGKRERRIKLIDFVVWANRKEWSLPDELKALAATTSQTEEAVAFFDGGEIGREAYRAMQIAKAEEVGRIEARAKPIVKTARLAPVSSASGDVKPWLVLDQRDPLIDPTKDQAWYTPARFFARQWVIEQPTLLAKRNILADKVSDSLFKVGIRKRGGKKKFECGTVLKALSMVILG
jgi:hypothetical protein